MSMRFPLCLTVREMPPISWLASSTMGCTSERRRNSRAAVSPAGPAPMRRAVLGMNTPDAYDRRPLAHGARTLTREHFFERPRAINTTVTGEMLDDTRISCHAALDAHACPDFLYAGQREGHVCGFH